MPRPITMIPSLWLNRVDLLEDIPGEGVRGYYGCMMLSYSHQAEDSSEAELPDLISNTLTGRSKLCEDVKDGQPSVLRHSPYILDLILYSLPAGIRSAP